MVTNTCLALALVSLFPVAEPALAQKPAQDKLPEKVRAAIKKGVEYLKSSQRDGNWEQSNGRLSQLYQGGCTTLALLALLEAGVKPDEDVVAKGLDYVRNLEPKMTYVVSLQTQVFCRAGQEKDLAAILKNVDWLERTMHRDGRFIGWPYSPDLSSEPTDNSNTQYAVLALHAARKAGARVKKKTWELLQDHYVGTQFPDGGWGYLGLSKEQPAPDYHRSTFSMTCAGVSVLLITSKELQSKEKVIQDSVAKGLDYVGYHFTRTLKPKTERNCYSGLHDLARLCELASKEHFSAKHPDQRSAWYRQGSEFLLKEQAANGSWSGLQDFDGKPPIISTSFALLFLSKAK